MGEITTIETADKKKYRVEFDRGRTVVRRDLGGRVAPPLFFINGAVMKAETILQMIDVFYQGKVMGELIGEDEARFNFKRSIAELLEPALEVIFDTYQEYKEAEKR